MSVFVEKSVIFKFRMITHPDHKRTKMFEAEKEKANEKSNQSQSNSDSESELDQDPDPYCRRYGNWHYEYRVNGELDHQFSAPIVYSNRAELHDSMKSLEEQILEGRVEITIKEAREVWDDIPSPPPEDLEAAIQIMDRYKLPDPIFPEVPETKLPDWD